MSPDTSKRCIVIGACAGGLEALQDVINGKVLPPRQDFVNQLLA